MERRHYITALFLLLLPVVVIYALTSYGIEESKLQPEKALQEKTSESYACQGKHLKANDANDTQLQ